MRSHVSVHLIRKSFFFFFSTITFIKLQTCRPSFRKWRHPTRISCPEQGFCLFFYSCYLGSDRSGHYVVWLTDVAIWSRLTNNERFSSNAQERKKKPREDEKKNTAIGNKKESTGEMKAKVWCRVLERMKWRKMQRKKEKKNNLKDRSRKNTRQIKNTEIFQKI